MRKDSESAWKERNSVTSVSGLGYEENTIRNRTEDDKERDHFAEGIRAGLPERTFVLSLEEWEGASCRKIWSVPHRRNSDSKGPEIGPDCVHPEIEGSWTWLKYRQQRGKAENKVGSSQMIHSILGAGMGFDGMYYHTSDRESLKAEMS